MTDIKSIQNQPIKQFLATLLRECINSYSSLQQALVKFIKISTKKSPSTTQLTIVQVVQSMLLKAKRKGVWQHTNKSKLHIVYQKDREAYKVEKRSHLDLNFESGYIINLFLSFFLFVRKAKVQSQSKMSPLDSVSCFLIFLSNSSSSMEKDFDKDLSCYSCFSFSLIVLNFWKFKFATQLTLIMKLRILDLLPYGVCGSFTLCTFLLKSGSSIVSQSLSSIFSISFSKRPFSDSFGIQYPILPLIGQKLV